MCSLLTSKNIRIGVFYFAFRSNVPKDTRIPAILILRQMQSFSTVSELDSAEIDEAAPSQKPMKPNRKRRLNGRLGSEKHFKAQTLSKIFRKVKNNLIFFRFRANNRTKEGNLKDVQNVEHASCMRIH